MYKTSFYRYIGMHTLFLMYYFSISGQGHAKIKMAVQRHLENGTFDIFIIE